MKKINFAWSCEISGAIVVATTFQTISHDYVKFLHVHAKSTYTSSLACNTNSLSSPIRMIMRICNTWFLSFPLSFFPFPSFNSTLTTSNYPKSKSKLIALLILLCIWIIINIIYSLEFNSSLLPSIYQNHILK